MSAQLATAASAAALEERALAVEGRAKALAASLGRKDAALREAQAAAAAAEAARAHAVETGAATGAAEAAKLKGELARREAALQVCLLCVCVWGEGAFGGWEHCCVAKSPGHKYGMVGLGGVEGA
jgi:hypothetical protein